MNWCKCTDISSECILVSAMVHNSTSPVYHRLVVQWDHTCFWGKLHSNFCGNVTHDFMATKWNINQAYKDYSRYRKNNLDCTKLVQLWLTTPTCIFRLSHTHSYSVAACMHDLLHGVRCLGQCMIEALKQMRLTDWQHASSMWNVISP